MEKAHIIVPQNCRMSSIHKMATVRLGQRFCIDESGLHFLRFELK